MVDSTSDILSYFTNRIQAAKEQQLKELDLSVPYETNPNDKLDHIPEVVFELTQLEKLNLRNNILKEIPESIIKLTNLTQLDLSDIAFLKLMRYSSTNEQTNCECLSRRLGYRHQRSLNQELDRFLLQ